MTRTLLAVAVTSLLGIPALALQPPSRPGQLTTPAWRALVKLADGRQMITDGGMVVDITLAKPATVPTQTLPDPSNTWQGRLAGPYTGQFGANQLRAGSAPGTYEAPGGLLLNTTYINFLRDRVPASRLTFATKGPFDPIVILVSGHPAGLLMPVAGPRRER
jgi:hypothetical protein